MPANPAPAASPSGRTRTPPDLKWLLNERAVLSGEAQLTSERLTVIQHRAAALEAQLAQARLELSQLSERAETLSERIGAFDATISAMHAGVRPDAAGCVKAYAGRYGEHGALTAFLREHLREISPQAVLASDLKKLVIARFQLVLVTPAERKNLKHSIRTVLGRLRDEQGVVETLENWRGRLSQPLWRWKQTPSTLYGPRQVALAAEAADECNPHSNPL